MMEQEFDGFLAHNSQDKPLIRRIYRQLKARGIKPWLDEKEIAPGAKFQDAIQLAINQSRVAAIFIGQEELGSWQAFELKVFITQCVKRDIPIIPVLLDNEVRKEVQGSDDGYFRWVRIVWISNQENWFLLPHQKEILGFVPPQFGGGATFSFTSPNFGKFHAAWDSLEAFQEQVFQKLMNIE
jgi:hypothetical protein